MISGTIKFRSGTSFARGVTIDGFLTPKQNAVLYEKWKDSWEPKVDCGGGEVVITCEMVAAVPYEELYATYKDLAPKLAEVAALHKEL